MRIVDAEDGLERRFLTTGTENDAKRIATRLVILKSEARTVKDWDVWPAESIALDELEEMLGMR